MSVYSTFGSIRKLPLPQRGRALFADAAGAPNRKHEACVAGALRAALDPNVERSQPVPLPIEKGRG